MGGGVAPGALRGNGMCASAHSLLGRRGTAVEHHMEREQESQSLGMEWSSLWIPKHRPRIANQPVLHSAQMTAGRRVAGGGRC